MTVTIDKAGRLVVPKALRQRLALKLNCELEIVDHPDGLLLRVPKSGPSLVAMNGLLVHQGRPEKDADWEGLLNSVRDIRRGLGRRQNL